MIIGFCGDISSGKDTSAAYLVAKHGFERRAFADKLKMSVAALFDIPFWEIDKLKHDSNVFVTIGYKNEPEFGDRSSIDHVWSPISEYSMRDFLKRYGTESHRDVLNNDLWVEIALPRDGFYAGKKLVISDVRFQNEVDRIVALGGMVCRLKRPETDNHDPHPSEQSLLLSDVGYEIMNNGTFDELYSALDKMLEAFESNTGVSI